MNKSIQNVSKNPSLYKRLLCYKPVSIWLVLDYSHQSRDNQILLNSKQLVLTKFGYFNFLNHNIGIILAVLYTKSMDNLESRCVNTKCELFTPSFHNYIDTFIFLILHVNWLHKLFCMSKSTYLLHNWSAYYKNKCNFAAGTRSMRVLHATRFR